MTDIPANIAQAARAWASLEAHLVERCGLGSSVSLERERPALIRIMMAALDGSPPAPAPVPALVREAPLPPVPTPTKYAAGVWFNGFDLPAPDLAATRADGPGFDCRQCGRRVRGARHTDPRLLCPTCTLSEGHSSQG